MSGAALPASLNCMKASELFTLPDSLARLAGHFEPEAAPWEWLPKIGAALAELPAPPEAATVPPGVHLEGPVWLEPSVRLPAFATLIGPLWIGAQTEVRPGAYLRGPVITGADCVLGNSCEFKNCLLLDGVQVPHFSYVGDSILGNRAHLGAGAICSNLRLDRRPVTIRMGEAAHATGLRKCGGFVGDDAEIGCNAVLNPGTVIGRRALVAPALVFGGYLPPATIARARTPVHFIARRD